MTQNSSMPLFFYVSVVIRVFLFHFLRQTCSNRFRWIVPCLSLYPFVEVVWEDHWSFFLSIVGTVFLKISLNGSLLHSSESRTIPRECSPLSRMLEEIVCDDSLSCLQRFIRMCDEHSQLGRVPSEASVDNQHTDTNINQLLTMAVVTTSQPLMEVVTTTIVVDATRAVQHVPADDNPTTRQLARRRRRQRRRQRRRDRRRDMIQQQRQRERQRWIPRSSSRDPPRVTYTRGHQRGRHSRDTFGNSWENYHSRRASADSAIEEILLDAYQSEIIDRRDRWQQEQLDDFEGFVVLEKLQLLNDQTEQQENIDAEERFAQAKEEERNDQELLQL